MSFSKFVAKPFQILQNQYKFSMILFRIMEVEDFEWQNNAYQKQTLKRMVDKIYKDFFT